MTQDKLRFMESFQIFLKVPRDGSGPLAQGNAPKEKPSIFSQGKCIFFFLNILR